MDGDGSCGDPFAWRNRCQESPVVLVDQCTSEAVPLLSRPCETIALSAPVVTSCSGELSSHKEMPGSVCRRSSRAKPLSTQPCNTGAVAVAGCSSGAAAVTVISCSTGVVGDTIVPSCSREFSTPDLNLSSRTARKKRRGVVSRTTQAEGILVEGTPHRRKSKRLRSIELMSENESGSCGNIKTGVGSTSMKRKRKSASHHSSKRGPGAKKPKKTSPASISCAAVNQPLPVDRSVLDAPFYCHWCYAKKFCYESKSFCCSKGEVKLVTNSFPAELADLYTREDDLGDHFRQYSRMYNNLFAYSSLGGNIDAGSQKGHYVFKLYGQIYHFVPELLPGEETPKYLQLYFFDGQFEAQNRCNAFPQVNKKVIEILMRVTSVNPYARFFRTLKDVQVKENTQIMLNQSPMIDQRVFNKPSTDEVAVIWPEGASSSNSLSPHILIRGHAGEAHRIYHHYGCYDPLQYPLLFPYGECGWRQGIKKNVHGHDQSAMEYPDPINSCAVHTTDDFLQEEHRRATKHRTRADKFVSPREYYAYKLQIRSGNMLLLTGRCLQQFDVDMYVKMENTRLDFVRNNQDTVRADLYQGVLDSFAEGENSAGNVGRRIILPPSFLGGPRDLKRRYLNAMALVQRFGKPDFFITMTCNTKWPEIQAELLPNQKVEDRPDLVARIFRAKLLALKKKIMKEHVLGEVAGMIYVVEFQKRGLPHAHFLIILKPDFRIKGPADYDRFVCAELPPIDAVLLRKSVLAHMMHGPCGHLRPDCPCMQVVNGKKCCKSKYPKSFNVETTTNDDGYPMYRRRSTGESVKIRGSFLDNRWVVPYNPYLLTLFDCHLNVEVCSTIKAVKYLYKYVYKGHDRVQFTVGSLTEGPVDEIDQYQSGRWVSPCEAVWRLFGFDLYEMHPPVLPLPIHVPNGQTIQMRPHEQLGSVIRDSKRSRTALTEFFAFNAAHPEKPKYLYREFSEHYRWDPGAKEWVRRKDKRKCIGRPAFVLPAEGERFFLRLLLLNVRAPKSFVDLRTVNGIVWPTFQEAALKLGLLEDDNAAAKCLMEAAAVHMPVALRRLFAVVLIFCQASDPRGLWEQQYQFLSEDYVQKYPHNPAKVKELTVASVEEYLQAMGKSLKAFGLEELQSAVSYDFRITKDVADALNEEIPSAFLHYKDKLNENQNKAFSAIMQCVKEKKGGAFFVDGPGGTGKTFLYNALFAEVRLMKKIVLPTASSGIAAANLPNGRTAHSRFKIPVDRENSLACDVPKQSSLASLIRETTLIIWDEASMANKSNVESLDMLLQDLCGNKDIFGGKLIVFGGDFRQVLPVVPHKTQREAVEASIASSFLWSQLTRFHLTENQRAREDPLYSSFLLSLGNGDLQKSENDYVKLPECIVRRLATETDPISDLITYTFPEINTGAFSSDTFSKRTILSPLNVDVDLINSHVINEFPGDPVVCKSYDVLLTDSCNVYSIECINSLCPGGMSPHELILKPGCPVLLIRNLLPSAGLCNGTRLVCKAFFPNVIECVIAVGQYMGQHVFIPRINLRPSPNDKFPFKFQRKQFPLKLAFAMTINKSQGQTLDQVSIYLPKPCFAHGQLYVALSRARSATKVTVFCTLPPLDQHKHSVKNVVSHAVLQLAGIK